MDELSVASGRWETTAMGHRLGQWVVLTVKERRRQQVSEAVACLSGLQATHPSFWCWRQLNAGHTSRRSRIQRSMFFMMSRCAVTRCTR